ncbi:MAG: methyltransferase domain-containing protein [Gammaproteobacteria bacterium]
MIGNRSPDSETQLALAQSLFDKGDDAEAARVLQLLIHTDPACLRAYDRLVDTFTRMRRLKDAAETYREWGRQIAGRTNAKPTFDETLSPTAAESVLVADSVAHYYAIRAPEYDQTSGYQSAQSSQFIDSIKAEVQATVRDRDAIEIACGTGFWTAAASNAARSLLATDRNVELVEMVQKRLAGAPNVKCQVADAYTLTGVEGPFTAAYAQFWWSHIPLSMIKTFLTALHAKLAENARGLLHGLPSVCDSDLASAG